MDRVRQDTKNVSKWLSEVSRDLKKLDSSWIFFFCSPKLFCSNRAHVLTDCSRECPLFCSLVTSWIFVAISRRQFFENWISMEEWKREISVGGFFLVWRMSEKRNSKLEIRNFPFSERTLSAVTSLPGLSFWWPFGDLLVTFQFFGQKPAGATPIFGDYCFQSLEFSVN